MSFSLSALKPITIGNVPDIKDLVTKYINDQSAAVKLGGNQKPASDNSIMDAVRSGALIGAATEKQETSPKTQVASAGSNANSDSFNYDGYKESDAVSEARRLIEQQMANKPGDFTYDFQAQLDDAYNRIMNREKFSYDLNGDALYQQYKDKYIQQGKMAMMDTMGQAAAMTGGYGNSYAQSVGQQAYQAQLQNLNDIVPELYQLAYDRYNQEGQDLLNQYALELDRENQAYSKYRDKVSDWNNELDRLYNQHNAEREFDYGKYADDRAYAYQQDRDRVSDEQWQKEFDEAQRQYNQDYALQQKELDEYIRQNNQDNGNNDQDDTSGSTDTSGSNNVYDVPADADSISKKLEIYIENGASNDEIRTILSEALNEGIISQYEYAGLLYNLGHYGMGTK